MTKNRHQNIGKDVEHKRTGNLEQTKKKKKSQTIGKTTKKRQAQKNSVNKNQGTHITG